ncbi:hypothetical protein AVEN_152911-1 [Araneus ventricosus]|uniref:Uncharacterized protein n=1 Tax=Araneus ventricosus TaxID=182803 RepID=A0A4Y2ADM8_ARAVE|nr:hypothetical protein AVEN_152911-1 [Araneus ventricosus]
MMDSSRSAQRAVIQFLRAEGEHSLQIYRRMKEGVRRAVFRTVHHIPGHVNIKDLPRPAQAHVVTNSAMISAVDELKRQNRRITTREIAVELLISKGTVHHIIHKKLGYGKVSAQWLPKHLLENRKTA